MGWDLRIQRQVLQREIGMYKCNISQRVPFFSRMLSQQVESCVSCGEVKEQDQILSVWLWRSAAARSPSWGLIELSRLQISHQGPMLTLSKIREVQGNKFTPAGCWSTAVQCCWMKSSSNLWSHSPSTHPTDSALTLGTSGLFYEIHMSHYSFGSIFHSWKLKKNIICFGVL